MTYDMILHSLCICKLVLKVLTCFESGLEKDSNPERMEKIQKMLDEEEQLHALDPPRSVSPLRRILKSVRKDAHDILF